MAIKFGIREVKNGRVKRKLLYRRTKDIPNVFICADLRIAADHLLAEFKK